jgi:hypothetical protein
VFRYDQDIDENNFRISTYETLFGITNKHYKKHKKVHEKLFVGNKFNNANNNLFHGNQSFRPTGFFRKIPKGDIYLFLCISVFKF